MTKKEVIENTVGEAMREMVEAKGIEFSYELVPAKPISSGGLGAKWNGWRAMLDTLAANRLPPKRPYTSLIVDVGLVDATFNKNLRSLRHWIVKRLLLIEKRNAY